MRKILLAIAALVAVSFAAACDGGSNAGTTDLGAPASQTAVESAAPSESVPTTVVDFRADVGAVTATLADKTKYPEGNAADVHFVITNHSGDNAAYAVTLAVYDKTGAQVGAILIDTEASGLGTVKPAGTMIIDGPYLADMEKLPTGFTVEVQSVDRIPEV